MEAITAAAASAPPPAPPTGPFVLPAGAPCGSCGGDVDINADGVKCGACFRVQYCNPACQKAHWAVHKEACGAATRARVHAGEGELEGAEGTLKRAMVACSSRVIVAATTEKLGARGNWQIASLDEIDDLVLTTTAPPALAARFHAAGIAVHPTPP